MHGSTLALVLCLALAPAFADEPAPARKLPADGLMHAALVVPAQAAQAAQGKPQGPVMQAKAQASPAAQADKEAAPPEGERRPMLAMVLAALAVMTGIVLRRWGGNQP